MRYRSLGWGLALCACASGGEPTLAAPEAAQVRREVARSFLGRKCSRPIAAAPGERDQLFVEALVLNVPRKLAESASLRTLEQVLAEPTVEMLGTPHLVVDVGQEGQLALVDVQGRTEGPSLHRMRLMPRRAEPDLTVLELEVTLQLPNPTALRPNPTRAVALTFSARDDVSALASAPWDEPGQRSLVVVVRPRSVRSDADFKAIFGCKMRERLELRRPP